MHPEEFDERFAAHCLTEHDPAWRQAGIIAATIVNAMRENAVLLGGMYVKTVANEEDFIPKYGLPEDIIAESNRRRPDDIIDTSLMEARFQAQYGVSE